RDDQVATAQQYLAYGFAAGIEGDDPACGPAQPARTEERVLDMQARKFFFDVVGGAVPWSPAGGEGGRWHGRRLHEDAPGEPAQRAGPASEFSWQQSSQFVQPQDEVDEQLDHADGGRDGSAEHAVDGVKKEAHRATVTQQQGHRATTSASEQKPGRLGSPVGGVCRGYAGAVIWTVIAKSPCAIWASALGVSGLTLLFETRPYPTVRGADITRRRWLRSMAERAAWQPRSQNASDGLPDGDERVLEVPFRASQSPHRIDACAMAGRRLFPPRGEKT